MTTLAARSRPIAIELHGLLRDLDPSRFRGEVVPAARERLADMAETVRRTLDDAADDTTLTAALADLASLLGDGVPLVESQATGATAGSEQWARYRKELGAAYESLRQRLRAQSIRVPGLRPTNYMRSFFHALMGVTCIVLVEYILGDRGRWMAPAAFAVTFWFLEGLRRVSHTANRALMWFFRHIAHPREAHHVNSSTWYTTALALLGLLFPKAMCTLGIAVIAFADPAASLVGRRWGRHKLVGERTIEGTATFAAVATAVGFAALRIWHPGEASPWRALAVAAAAGITAAVAELTSRRLDDNFTVPMVAGSVGWLVLALA
jgi:dolichol kinase